MKELEDVKTLDELYNITAQVLEKAKINYPDMLCKAGCNQCCKNYGSPQILPIEWENIKEYLDNSDEHYKTSIKKSLLEIKNNLREMLNRNNKLPVDKVVNNITCPFLQNELCSIYPIRPLVCRMFGSFLSKPGLISGNSVYTCGMEKDRWDEEISITKPISINLPSKVLFYKKLEQINDKRGKPKTLIYYLNKYFFN
jgi:Fe-S-cluster containining protein